jgi:hypothetical protein
MTLTTITTPSDLLRHKPCPTFESQWRGDRSAGIPRSGSPIACHCRRPCGPVAGRLQANCPFAILFVARSRKLRVELRRALRLSPTKPWKPDPPIQRPGVLASVADVLPRSASASFESCTLQPASCARRDHLCLHLSTIKPAGWRSLRVDRRRWTSGTAVTGSFHG